jgi:DNA-binding FadR family transcriptional regulator
MIMDCVNDWSKIVGEFRPPRAADLFAARLREQILEGALPAGTPLPTERELTEQSGLSRTTVREGLRALEIEGLARTRPGRNGGTVVHRPNVDTIARSMDHVVRVGNVRFASLLEVRELLEPRTAQLAALRATDAQVAELEALHQRILTAADDPHVFATVNVEWHVAIAAASGNEIFATFMQGLAGVIQGSTETQTLDLADVREQVLQSHQAIMDAIRSGDADAAERRMRRHIVAFREETTRP